MLDVKRKARNWRVAEAKEKFSEVLRAATEGPQLIFSRDRLVAAVVDPTTLQELQNWKAQARRALADTFLELRALCEAEGYILKAPPRRDRADTFADALDKPSR